MEISNKKLKIKFRSGNTATIGSRTFWVGIHKDSKSLVILKLAPESSYPYIERYEWIEVVEVDFKSSENQ